MKPDPTVALAMLTASVLGACDNPQRPTSGLGYVLMRNQIDSAVTRVQFSQCTAARDTTDRLGPREDVAPAAVRVFEVETASRGCFDLEIFTDATMTPRFTRSRVQLEPRDTFIIVLRK